MDDRAIEPVRVAVVGLGWWGRRILAGIAASPLLEAVAGVDPDPAAARAACDPHGLATYGSLEEALAHPGLEGVVIVTPHGLHESQVLAAAQAGKHVFCEKPFALGAAAARRMVRACTERGLRLGVGHERRFEPAVRALAAKVRAGDLGTLLHIDGHWSHNTMTRPSAPGWRQDAAQAPCGSFTATGIHVTDLMQSIAGRVAEVDAREAKRSDKFPGRDVLVARLQFASGVTGQLANLAATPFYSRIGVFGDGGWAEIRDHAFGDVADPSELLTRDLALDYEARTFRPREVVRLNLEAWAGSVRGVAEYPFTPDQLVHNVEILEAIVASAQRREPVRIPASEN